MFNNRGMRMYVARGMHADIMAAHRTAKQVFPEESKQGPCVDDLRAYLMAKDEVRGRMLQSEKDQLALMESKIEGRKAQIAEINTKIAEAATKTDDAIATRDETLDDLRAAYEKAVKDAKDTCDTVINECNTDINGLNDTNKDATKQLKKDEAEVQMMSPVLVILEKIEAHKEDF